MMPSAGIQVSGPRREGRCLPGRESGVQSAMRRYFLSVAALSCLAAVGCAGSGGGQGQSTAGTGGSAAGTGGSGTGSGGAATGGSGSGGATSTDASSGTGGAATGGGGSGADANGKDAAADVT